MSNSPLPVRSLRSRPKAESLPPGLPMLHMKMIRMRLSVARLRAELLERRYNPNQPRVPAGRPGGGRWTDGGGGTGGGSPRGQRFVPHPGQPVAKPSPKPQGPAWTAVNARRSVDGRITTRTYHSTAGTRITESVSGRPGGAVNGTSTVIQDAGGDRLRIEDRGGQQTLSHPKSGQMATTRWTTNGL